MNLYRFEVVTKSEVIPVIIAADHDDTAFQLVEVELEKYFLKLPDVEEVILYEKKRLGKGTGFVLYEKENDIGGA
jgi:hypothetical protein